MHRRLWSKKTVYPKGTKFNYNFRADSPGRIGYLFGSNYRLFLKLFMISSSDIPE